MINVDFYSFSKRKNSTKKPTGTAHTVSVCFKEETEIERPTIEVHDGTIAGYNYAYIAYTGRYYWVSGKRSIAKDTFEIDLVEDYLASHIDGVRGQNVYCTMSSVAFNNLLDDSRVTALPATKPNQTAVCTNFNLFSEQSDGSAYVFEIASVLSQDGVFNGLDIVTAWGSGQNYIHDACNPSTYTQIKRALDGGDPLDFVGEVWGTPLNPLSCHDLVNDTITIAGQSYNVDRLSAYALRSKPHSQSIILPTPTVGDFRYSERFVKYYFLIPFIGIVSIPTELVRDSSHLMNVYWSGNSVSGEFIVTANINGVNLGFFATNLKCPIPIKSQSSAASHAIVGGIKGAVKGGAAGAVAGGVWGAIGGALGGGIGGAVKGGIFEGDNVERVMASVGGIGLTGVLPAITKPTVLMIEHESDIDPATLTPFGRPCGKVLSVANGYMQTVNASLSFAGTDGEINEVNNAFNGGVYVE